MPLPGRRTVRVSQVADTELLIDLTERPRQVRDGREQPEERRGKGQIP